MTDPLVRAVEAVDELVVDGEGVVLLNDGGAGRLVRLSPLGLAVRRLTREGMPLSRLGAHLTDEFGSPEDGDVEGAVRAVVEDLASQGVVEMVEVAAPGP
ncbi:hypothetical protein [Intrasporangium sp.]|uniref:hypothetical protein n=1 Tax=Intrasporangium sp. TaxID=1925024 RepID=UPI00293A5A93|nr:hypothetical protein [Intrasporangium sp.]MDV3223460.1 hypothetical protein [Intrasporangium sp.]